MPISSSRPCRVLSPGWNGISGCRFSTGVSHPAALTEHGVALKAGAQRILEAVQAARDDVTAVSGLVHGTVTLASTLNTGTIDLAGVLAGLRDRHPGVIVKLRQSPTGCTDTSKRSETAPWTSRCAPALATASKATSRRAGSSCTSCGVSRLFLCAALTIRSADETGSVWQILRKK